LKVNDEIAGSPDPLVRGMDPRIQIRIRIHTKKYHEPAPISSPLTHSRGISRSLEWDPSIEIYVRKLYVSIKNK
jgi:hypothetical protein